MPELPLYQVDAFARRVFEGNPAAVVPLEVAELCGQVLKACQELVDHGLPSMRSDVQTAFFLARAGLAAALANVAINLEDLDPAVVPDDLRARYDAARQVLATAPPGLP